MGLDVVALLAGSGSEADTIQRLAVKAGVSDLVRLLGYVDSQLVLWASDVSVLPSRQEGFALVVVETMMCGVMPIRTRRQHCPPLPKGALLSVGDGKLKETLEKKIRDEGVRQVHFLGYRADVPQILQVTDIATLVSMREGLPKSIMEAMAAGTRRCGGFDSRP